MKQMTVYVISRQMVKNIITYNTIRIDGQVAQLQANKKKAQGNFDDKKIVENAIESEPWSYQVKMNFAKKQTYGPEKYWDKE